MWGWAKVLGRGGAGPFYQGGHCFHEIKMCKEIYDSIENEEETFKYS